MSEIIKESELDVGSITGVYQDMYAAGINTVGDKLMIRNTTLLRLQFRIGDDNSTNTFTISPGEKMIIGGFSALAGNRIQVRTATDVAESIRLNIYS